MKKALSILLVCFMLFALAGCGSSGSGGTKEPVNSVEVDAASPAQNETETQDVDEPDDEDTDGSGIDISALTQGDEVSIVGQKANSTLVNGKTIWVQVLRDGERSIIYYCQLKDEYLEQGEALKMLDIVKVKGYYLSTMDMEQENTAIIVNLYDCEILE